MPRRISKSSPKDFEPKVKNRFSLGSDSNIDNDFKAFKIGDTPTGLEFKLGAIKSTVDEFITKKETTEVLEVTKIKGNKGGESFLPQVLITNPWDTNQNYGISFNITTSGTSHINVTGDDAALFLESDTHQYYNIGDDSNNSFIWRYGDLSGSSTLLMSLEHEGELKLYSTADSGDYFSIAIGSAGATTVTTVDDGGAAAHLTLDPDGEINLTPVTEVKSDAPLKIKEAANAIADTAAYGQLWIKTATPNQLYFTTDAGDDIQITSGTSIAGGGGISWDGSTANGVATYKDGDEATVESNLTFDGTDLSISSTGKLILGAGDTYLHESSADVLQIYTGGDKIVEITEAGLSGNKVDFGTSGVGFTQFEPTYNASDTDVAFSFNGNKAFCTFGSGNITDMNLFFPDVSCNCVLLLKQDGSGSRTVTNWKTFDQASGNESTVAWAGGSAPTLTTTANKLDILSFYWDNDNHKAYGVASLNF